MKTLFLFVGWLVGSVSTLAQNVYWTATPGRNGQLVLTHGSERLTLQPTFQLLFRPDDPALRLPRALHLASELPAWKRLDGRGSSFDLYQCVKPVSFRLKNTQIANGQVRWTFTTTPGEATPGELLEATLTLADRFPVVNWRYVAMREGFAAITFAPFAPVPKADLGSLWQPLIWTERRMPDSSYVSAEFMAPLPMTLMEQGGQTRGISAHPSEIPYRMPNLNNSRFAVLLRNASGQAQPTLMAPFFGRTGTRVKAGDSLTFTTRIIATPGRTDQAYQTVARQLFAFRDYRQNSTCSLNETIQNMTRFALDDHQCQWMANLRGSNYVTDVAGTVKNVSALHPLSVAILTDNEQLFRRRAVPMTEYMLSREKYLFTLFDGKNNQNPSHFLRGPAAEVSELGALYTYSNGNSPFFRQYALDLSTKTRRLNPIVPPGTITVHPGDSIRMYYRNRNLSPNPRSFPVREQQVAAWRVSNIGLTSESSYTFRQNPAVLLAHYAPYMLRIGHYANDPFLSDIARSAVVGRYANYPGYDINQEFTTHNQQADYPLHDVNEMTYNQLYYNHVWPHIALLYDYLMADAEVKSGGKIKFPAQYAQGYAYLQSKVYGAAPGAFYGDQNVMPWLPADLLKTDNVQINHVAGYGNGNFYLAFTNQSPTAQTVAIQLNPDVLPFDTDKNYSVRVIRNNQPAEAISMQNGRLTATVDGHGVVGFVVEKLSVRPTFQPKLKPIAALAGQTGFSEQTTPQGKINGLLLSWGENLHQAYIYLTATEKDLKEARLHYTLDGKKWQTTTDASYPFEFSIPLTDAERLRGFQYRVESTVLNGKSEKTNDLTLR